MKVGLKKALKSRISEINGCYEHVSHSLNMCGIVNCTNSNCVSDCGGPEDYSF